MNKLFHTLLLPVIASSVYITNASAISLEGPQRTQVLAEKAFSASGEVALPNIDLPATLHFSEEKQAFLIEVSISEFNKSYIYYDWDTNPAKGYIQSTTSCTSFSLGDSKAPSIRNLFKKSRSNKKNTSEKQGISWQKNKNKNKEDILKFQFKETALLFKVNSIKPMHQNLFNPANLDSCIDIKAAHTKNMNKIKKVKSNKSTSSAKETQEDFSISNLLYNFYGFYSSVEYTGSPFYQNANEHKLAVNRCKKDGGAVCKTEWEIGGLFGRYGYYCGDGWDNKPYQPMSSLDYCCQMHDRHAWGDNHLKNLCGFYACVACSDKGSYQAFMDEHDAADIIEKFTKTGTFLTGCSFDGWVSGFSCNN
ncbi:hypothetical protein [Spartinivicinus ruber]|uniref:hypothetical protein n=1 Tax=Spartinivicinus ruber TaxID=2683272 RepID=UPI0013D5E82E|nr:hypothetical protein [Spartinivicinus ruber]